MQLILFVLHDVENLDRVLNAWEAVGVGGVTILPSTGLMRLRNHRAGLREDLPLIPRLEDFISQGEYTNRTLFAIVPTTEMADRVIAATENIVGDLDLPHTGILAVLPVATVKGLFRREE